MSLKRRLEALLFTREEALPLNLLSEALQTEISAVLEALEGLQQDYQHSALEIIEVTSGWRFQLRPEYHADIQKLAEVQPPRYSRAFWEVLAFIAYNQPVTRSEIDHARGVQTSSNIYQQLFHLEWIEVVGHKKALGSPELLAVTKRFLDDFALKSTDDLPNLSEMNALGEKIDEF